MTNNTNKERTSITIDPELLTEAKSFCKEASVKSAKKLSFSELVTQALRTYIHEDDEDNQPSAYTIHAD